MKKERYLNSKRKIHLILNQLKKYKLKVLQIDDFIKNNLEKLEQISGLDIEKAKALIISSTEKEWRLWIKLKKLKKPEKSD
jgi:hypothetical protein